MSITSALQAPIWPLQDAKARFSELVATCMAEGPQTVTKHGEPAVVVLPVAEYKRLSAKAGKLGAFFVAAPRVELELEREPGVERDLEL